MLIKTILTQSMKKLLTQIVIAVAGFTGVAVAQQDPQFSQFMQNKLIYNPGYAGTSGGVCGVMQFRQQWANFQGSPQSIAVAADMPLANIPLGVGLTVMNDKIGPMSSLFIRAAGSFNKKIGKGTLGIGLDVGVMQKKISADWITPESTPDNRIPGNYGDFSNPDFGKMTYDVGFGAFYNVPNNFYVGISGTHLPGQEITAKEGDTRFTLSRHIYLMGGKTFQINKWNKITPNVLVKTDLAASVADLNLTYMWSDMIWVGGSYRTSAAFIGMLGLQSKFSQKNMMFRAGYSYDFSTSSQLKKFGSHEIILGACFIPEIKKPTSYDTDRFIF